MSAFIVDLWILMAYLVLAGFFEGVGRGVLFGFLFLRRGKIRPHIMKEQRQKG